MQTAMASPASLSSRVALTPARVQQRARFVAGARRGAVSVRAVLTDAKELNEKFGIPGSVEIAEGKDGSTVVKLSHASGTTAEVYQFGACITSWKQPSGDEVLYVRPDAKFDQSKPISGGVPHCFPQFGPGEMQQHGFARNLDWEISSTSADVQPDDKDPEVEFVLTPNEYTRAMWDFDFKAIYTVTIHGDNLRTDLRVINEGDKPFEFTSAMHTYFEVAGIENAKVNGLKGLKRLSKPADDPANPIEGVEDRDSATFSEYTDNVYINAPEHIELDVGTGAAVAIDSTGWTDAVVWSPWTTMEACYKEFCCVENAKTAAPVELGPGEFWRATQDMYVVDL